MGFGDIVDAVGNVVGKIPDLIPPPRDSTVGPAPVIERSYAGDAVTTGGAGPEGPPPISDEAIIQGLIALGYSPQDALAIFYDNPDAAMLMVNMGIGPDGSSGGGSVGGGGGGGGSSAGVDLGYAQLGESQRQFDLEYNEGVRQFNASFDRKAFESDREYELAKDQFALTYAENKRQFDANYGLDARSLDLQTELGRGNLALGQDRLALDSELGRGRLALDTELGRGDLQLGRDRLALDDRLGTGRLNLDTELGRGQLGINQNAEQRMQRAQVAAERLANRDQELQRTQFVTDVLRKPSDFLARAFMQRGGTAPTGMVTQADIINNLKSSINQFAQGGTTNETMFTTGEQGGRDSTELILNPANAPLQILNPQQTQQVMNTPTPQAAPNWNDLMGRLGTWRDQMQSQVQQYLPNFQFGAVQSGQMNTLGGGPLQYSNNPAEQQAPNGIYGNQVGSGHNPVPGRIGTHGGPTGSPSIQPVPNGLPVGGFGNNGVGYNPAAMQPGSTPDWAAALAGTNDTINPMTLPNVTQQQLIDIGRANLPPAVEAALFSQSGRIPYARPVGNLTLGRLAQLTPGELEALNTQLGVQFNTDLETEMALLRQRFGPVVDRARGRLILQ